MNERLVIIMGSLLLLELSFEFESSFHMPSQLSYGLGNQGYEVNNLGQIRAPTHLDIESQSLREELAMINNLTPASNVTNDSTINNQTSININESNSTTG